jgi:hypothetical protein
VLYVEARTDRGQGPDGTRPGVEVGSLLDGSNGLRMEAGWSARAQGRRSSPVAPGSRSWEGPHRGGEVLGLVQGRQATLDTSNRCRAEEKQRIWDWERLI